jgi:K+-sensing histidine kinase KdpD
MSSEPPLTPDHIASPGSVLALAVLGPLLVSGALIGFRHEFGPGGTALVLVLVVFAAGTIGGRRGGIVSALVAALCFDFFFTQPYYSLTIDSRDDIETAIVLLIVGAAVGELVARERRSRRMAQVKKREVDQIRRVAELGAGARPDGRLITIVQREVVDLLSARGARFERPPFPTTLPRLGHERLTLPAHGDGVGPPAGPNNEVELQVWGRGREIGRLVVTLAVDSTLVTMISAEDRALAVALADQLGAVLAAGNGHP